MYSLCLVLISLLWYSTASAQLWSGILDDSRATEWSQAGVTGGIPNRTNICSTVQPYGASGSPQSSSTIVNAIRACHKSGGGVVQLAAGKFYLSDSLGFLATGYSAVQNVTLRGMGPDQTHLIFTGHGGSNAICPMGGLICVTDGVISNAQCNWATGLNTANWTANYATGTTQIVLDNITGNSSRVPNKLAAGMYFFLDQADTPNSEFPTYGPFATSDPAYIAYPCSTTRAGRCVGEWHKVVSISGTGPYTVTITPGLNYTYWQSARKPGAWWCGNTSQIASGNGVEDLTVENQTGIDNTQALRGLITFGGAVQSWVKNVRGIRSGGAYVMLFGAANIEVRDSYFYTNVHPTLCANPAGTVTYGIDPIQAGLFKLENNIFHQTCKALMAQSCWVCVYGYNFTVGDLPQVNQYGTPYVTASSAPNHVAATHMLLWEGNEGNAINHDHGSGHGAGVGLLTAFRNRFTGAQPSNPLGGQTPKPAAPVSIGATNRFVNYIGNVLGDPSLTSAGWKYQSSPVTGGNTLDLGGFIWSIGWSRMKGPDDPITYTSLLRWGNFDYVTNAVRWNTGEIPSGQFLPPQTLPASFYLSIKPTWFGNQPWPAIGPDVEGGTDPSGHAANIPAKNCYLSVMRGPADGSGGVLTFNAASCYGSTTNEPAPAAPSGLRVS